MKILDLINYRSLSVVIFLLSANISQAGLKIYYIRHAEAGHNVKKEWEEKGVPKSEWPEYVGNPDMFTPTGKENLTEATEKLQNYTFDFITTSPIWRARNTLLPYLKASKQTAEVWPELREGPGMKDILAKDLPEVGKEILNLGEKIELPEEEASFFTLRPEAPNNYLHYPKKCDEKLKFAYMKHVTEHAISLIEQRFGDTDKSILLAGHNSSGVSLLHLLLGEKPSGRQARRGLNNVGVWMVEKQEDGSYKLMMYNDETYVEEEKK